MFFLFSYFLLFFLLCGKIKKFYYLNGLAYPISYLALIADVIDTNSLKNSLIFWMV